ncbi:hypothetical protein H5410_006187, partial [Solanum commersonii]
EILIEKLFIVIYMQLTFIASTHAAISPEVYWKIKLPKAQIPKVIKDLLPQAVILNEAFAEVCYWIVSILVHPRFFFLSFFNLFTIYYNKKKKSMKLQLLYSTILLLTFIASTHAAISPEVYWKIKLPKAQIPKVIKDLLPQADDGILDTKKKVYYGLHQHGAWIFHAATEDEIHEIKNETPTQSDHQDNFLYKPYFFEKELVKGKVINFPSLKNKNKAPFWPRQFVESIPFSSKKIPQILNYFSINNNSKDAKTIEETVKVCEEPAMKGEKRKCATSLESMVDFGIFMLGTNNVKVVATEVQGENQMVQKYTIKEVELMADGLNMICHKLNYAYAVHFCHGGGGTKTYMVSMIAVDGTKVKAISICHKDTSLWNPKGLPFVVLNAKPGAPSICHYLQDDQIVFLPYQVQVKYI